MPGRAASWRPTYLRKCTEVRLQACHCAAVGTVEDARFPSAGEPFLVPYHMSRRAPHRCAPRPQPRHLIAQTCCPLYLCRQLSLPQREPSQSGQDNTLCMTPCVQKVFIGQRGNRTACMLV